MAMAMNQEENLGPMKLIFNYNNVFYSFFYDDLSGCIHRSREYALNYVYSGEMILDNGTEKIHVRKGISISTTIGAVIICIIAPTFWPIHSGGGGSSRFSCSAAPIP